MARVRKNNVVSIVGAVLTLLLGLAVMWGWLHGNETLTRVLANYPSMKPNSAIGFAGASLSLLFLNGARKLPLLRWVALVLATGLIVLSGASLYSDIADVDLGIDALLLGPDSNASAPEAARMAFNSAVSFVMIGPMCCESAACTSMLCSASARIW